MLWVCGSPCCCLMCAARTSGGSLILCNLREARSLAKLTCEESGDQTAFVHRGGLTMPHRMLFALSVLLVSVQSVFFVLLIDAHICKLFGTFRSAISRQARLCGCQTRNTCILVEENDFCFMVYGLHIEAYIFWYRNSFLCKLIFYYSNEI